MLITLFLILATKAQKHKLNWLILQAPWIKNPFITHEFPMPFFVPFHFRGYP